LGIKDRLNLPDPEPWKPEAGDSVIGTLVDIGEREGDWGPYPVFIIETEDGTPDPVVAVHAFHGVLKNELANAQIGDEVGIAYRGMKKGKTQDYENYKVVIERNGAPAAQESLPAHAAAAREELAEAGADDEEPF